MLLSADTPDDPIAGEIDSGVLNINFWRVLCYVMIFALAYAVEHFFESIEFKFQSS